MQACARRCPGRNCSRPSALVGGEEALRVAARRHVRGHRGRGPESGAAQASHHGQLVGQQESVQDYIERRVRGAGAEPNHSQVALQLTTAGPAAGPLRAAHCKSIAIARPGHASSEQPRRGGRSAKARSSGKCWFARRRQAVYWRLFVSAGSGRSAARGAGRSRAERGEASRTRLLRLLTPRP